MEAVVEPSSGAVVVRCQFSAGDPADAEVLVYSPAEPARIFQRLRTDLRGHASFVPDGPGLWRVVADDGLGHRTSLEIAVDEAGVPVSDTGPQRIQWRQIVTGVLIACALVLWWLRDRRGDGS